MRRSALEKAVAAAVKPEEAQRTPKELKAAAEDPAVAAKAANLKYATDERPGIRRVRSGKGFRYVGPDGKAVRDEPTLSRIRSLAIPPAWEQVWIAAEENGHLQATGRDARGRKQFRYHPRWTEVRDETKYYRMLDFAQTLPRIRRRVAKDLARPGLPYEKVMAAVVRLLETTLIRIGNDEYAKTNQSYGLTTLQDEHAKIRGGKIHFNFRGKSGVERELDLNDKRLARIVKQCQDLPGQQLMQYVDEDGGVHPVGSSEVNEYLREVSGGQHFTAKDFRTWAGTVLASLALQELEKIAEEPPLNGRIAKPENVRKKRIVRAVENVAKRLGNTPSVCRKCYVHPAVLDAYLDGTLIETVAQNAEKEMQKAIRGLRAEEVAVLVFLQRRLKKGRRAGRAGKDKPSAVA